MLLRNLLFGKRDRSSLEHLRTQLYRAERVDRVANTAMRTIAPGLAEVIVEERGGTTRILRWDDLDGTDRDALFAAARGRAALAERKVEWTLVADYVQVVASHGPYLSAHLLASFEREQARHGVLFVPLSRHHWCVHVLQRLSTPAVVALLHLVAADVAALMRVTDADTLPRTLYWHRPNKPISAVPVAGSGAELHTTSRELERVFDDVLDG